MPANTSDDPLVRKALGLLPLSAKEIAERKAANQPRRLVWYGGTLVDSRLVEGRR